MTCNFRTAACACLTLGLVLSVAISPAAPSNRTITCVYLDTEDLKFQVPAHIGGLPAIDFDYPAKVTLFSFRAGHLLLVAMDEDESSRLRIVISAQLNKFKRTYDGQIVVDRGGHQLQLYGGPVRCSVGQ